MFFFVFSFLDIYNLPLHFYIDHILFNEFLFALPLLSPNHFYDGLEIEMILALPCFSFLLLLPFRCQLFPLKYS